LTAILKTYLEIIALRKGPDVIPASWLVLSFSLLLLTLAWTIQLSVIDVPDGSVQPALIAYAAALAFYAIIASLLGFRHRLLPMISTIIACGSMIAVASTVGAVMLAPLTGAAVANSFATVVWFWSVPVKGHIIARTVEKHWFFGIGIAMFAFLLRFGVETSLLANQQGAVS
jgi:hypothetical protein